MAQAIRRAKYGGRADLWAPLARGLQHTYKALQAWSPDVVVPVPSHPSRLAERGHNPAALLASELALALGIALDTTSLTRIRRTKAQASLPRAARLLSPKGSFAVRGNKLAGMRILLVDDVRTTGSTMAAARDALATAKGARCLSVTLALSET